ncbi:MAG: YifB family Mg chelatase-like AAA ATPase [Minisyncoccales bacterium]
MLSKVFSAALNGLNAQIVEVEVDASYGLPSFNIVGLPDKAVQESKDRVASAIKSSNYQAPHQQPTKTLVSLAPADLKKEGSLYDLPISLGFLMATKQITFDSKNRLLIGELSLDGNLKPIKGALSFALLAKEMNFKEIILPWANSTEAALVQGIKIIGAKTLKEVIEYLTDKKSLSPAQINLDEMEIENYPIDLSWIKGQEYAKRALEIAAAGGHHLLMVGPPGAGKSLLAKCLPTIMPPLSFDEIIEVSKIYSAAGLLSENKPLIKQRPFRSPHHTTSEAALIGGGNPPRPGEITLAHRGVLFLDEFPEFHRDVLESLRQPIEEGEITILRAKHFLKFPARFTLVAAANPCPCGNWGNPEIPCQCHPSQIHNYRRKLSGPLIDRIDIFITVPQLKYDKLTAPIEGINSSLIRERVKRARLKQKERLANSATAEHSLTNAEMNIPQIKKYCSVDEKSSTLLKKYVDSGKLSARGYHRVLKVARTIADLDNSEKIQFSHVSEALMYRLREN